MTRRRVEQYKDVKVVDLYLTKVNCVETDNVFSLVAKAVQSEGKFRFRES